MDAGIVEFSWESGKDNYPGSSPATKTLSAKQVHAPLPMHVRGERTVSQVAMPIMKFRFETHLDMNLKDARGRHMMLRVDLHTPCIVEDERTSPASEAHCY